MNYEFSQQQAFGMLKQRAFLIALCSIVSLSNLLLGVKIFFSEEKWVLIPQFDTDQRIPISSSCKPEIYYIRWADGIVRSLLCVNPDSAPWKVHQILEISTLAYGQMKESLEKEAQKIKENNMSTVFYPKEFEVNLENQQVKVRGQYLAFFGKDKDPIIRDKVYALEWATGPHGATLLKSFKEENQ